MYDITKDNSLACQIRQKICSLTGREIEHGVVAGGAVAGWLIEHARGIKPKLNDIDLFINSHKEANNDAQPTRCATVTVDCHRSASDIPRLGNASDRSYTIVSTNKEGILNTVEISMEQETDQATMASALLQGFDLNCCQAGLDMATGQIVATEEFLRFLHDYQLMVTCPVTPHHTVMRIPKKAKELGCYINYTYEYGLLAFVPVVQAAKTDSNEQYVRCFSRLHLPEYLAHKKEIDPYFSLQTYSRGHKTYYEKCVMSENITVPGLYEFVPRFHVDLPEELRNTIMPTAALRNYYDSICRPKSKGSINKNKAVAKRKELLPYLLSIRNYTRCDIHQKHMDKIVEFNKKHAMSAKLGLLELNLAGQVEVIRGIEYLAKKHGNFIYGITEDATVNDIQRLKTMLEARLISDTKAITVQWTEALYDEYIKMATMQLTEPLDIAGVKLPEGATVRELLCQADLDLEGFEMSHCVAGKAYSLRNGYSAIFSILHKKERSTLEIAKPQAEDQTTGHLTYPAYSIVQHKGLQNCKPSKDHLHIASTIVRHFNDTNRQEKHQRKENLALCA